MGAILELKETPQSCAGNRERNNCQLSFPEFVKQFISRRCVCTGFLVTDCTDNRHPDCPLKIKEDE